MSEWVIEAEGMSRQFGDYFAVNNVDLKVPKGCIYGFLGPNGSGKSTSIRMLTGLLTPTKGKIKVLNCELPEDAEKLRNQIGYMTQKFSLYENLSLLENLQFVSKIYSIEKHYAKQRIDELLTLYHLTDKKKVMAGSLSGGQKQRLALAAATLHKPSLLFLDEPTSAVDPENRREFWERLFDLSDAGTSILVSTHYMDEAERCHRIAILETGEKRADGSPDELMQQMQADVVEIDGQDLRNVKRILLEQPNVLSAAQIGLRLRVLIKKDSLSQLESIKVSRQLQINYAIVRPSLEDVFVANTGAVYAQHH
jgi:ABC-2 type transport system ATP-binding protein